MDASSTDLSLDIRQTDIRTTDIQTKDVCSPEILSPKSESKVESEDSGLAGHISTEVGPVNFYVKFKGLFAPIFLVINLAFSCIFSGFSIFEPIKILLMQDF